MQVEPAQPCQFGSGGSLFGLYHAVAGRARAAVLLCPPLGQNMIRSHRVYRQLADALALQGVAALRFDYFGTGDSAGASGDTDLARCVADAVTAAAELRARSGCSRLVGFGARLGGAIALEAAPAARLAEVMLWDPVFDGRAYVASLDAMQEELRADPMRFSTPRTREDAAGQWLGFPVGAELRRQLEGWRAAPAAIPVRVFDSASAEAGADRHAGLGTGAEVVTLSSTASWDVLDRLEHAILAPDLVRAVVDQLRGAP
jgi:hypothetical protein